MSASFVYQLIDVQLMTLGIFDSIEKARLAGKTFGNEKYWQINRIPLNVIGRYSESFDVVESSEDDISMKSKLYAIFDIYQNATYFSSYDKAIHHFHKQMVEYRDALLMHFPYRPFMIEYTNKDGVFEESLIVSYEEFCKRI